MLVYSFMNIFSTDAPRPAWECNILYPLFSSSCILQSIFCVGEKKHKHLIRHCFCLLCDHSARENENLNSVHCSNEKKGFCNMHMDKLCNKCHFSWVVYCYEQCVASLYLHTDVSVFAVELSQHSRVQISTEVRYGADRIVLNTQMKLSFDCAPSSTIFPELFDGHSGKWCKCFSVLGCVK